MTKRPSREGKIAALKRHQTLNPHPERVCDGPFRENDFFDPYDLLQVKYEMLRCVELEGQSVSESAERFGFSRPSLYQARRGFEQAGLSGLIPRRRGPRRAHKLGDEVMQWVEQVLKAEAALSARALVDLVQERFALVVHPRSIERALQRRQKKGSARGRSSHRARPRSSGNQS
jgi:transposase